MVEEEVKTIVSIFDFLIASSRWNVFSMFSLKEISGLLKPVLTSGFAAKWKIRLTSDKISFIEDELFRSLLKNWKFFLFKQFFKFSFVPEDKLSRTLTCKSFAS